MHDNKKILLFSDLDRTIIPNGLQEESPDARFWLERLVKRPEVTLAYVTGRDSGLIVEAIKTWMLPLPSIVVGDVGTSIYTLKGDSENPEFIQWMDWKKEIAKDWDGKKSGDIARLFSGFDTMRLQEQQRQKDFKLSFYVDIDTDLNRLAEEIRVCLVEKGMHSSIITSIDETEDIGLVDIVPERATKMHAVYFIIDKLGIDKSRVVYAGDSGNDLMALTSGLQSVLVKNASEEVCRQAIEMVSKKMDDGNLYLAEGGFMEMNGNYAAGVLEGLAHFFPETEKWLREDAASL